MDSKRLEVAIRSAREAADRASEYRSEIFLAVMLAELLRANEGLGEIATTALVVRDKRIPPQQKRLSASEFFASKTCSSENDKVIIAGAFLEAHAGLSNYTIKEVRDCLISAKVSLPKNISLAFLRAAQRGWVMDVPGGNGRGKAWELTQCLGKRRMRSCSQPRRGS
jgi:hypothetical protein